MGLKIALTSPQLTWSSNKQYDKNDEEEKTKDKIELFQPNMVEQGDYSGFKTLGITKTLCLIFSFIDNKKVRLPPIGSKNHLTSENKVDEKHESVSLFLH